MKTISSMVNLASLRTMPFRTFITRNDEKTAQLVSAAIQNAIPFQDAMLDVLQRTFFGDDDSGQSSRSYGRTQFAIGITGTYSNSDVLQSRVHITLNSRQTHYSCHSLYPGTHNSMNVRNPPLATRPQYSFKSKRSNNKDTTRHK